MGEISLKCSHTLLTSHGEQTLPIDLESSQECCSVSRAERMLTLKICFL